MEMVLKFKDKVVSLFSSLLSTIGVGGSSTSTVCQATCSATSSISPIFGFSLAFTPFAFLYDYQIMIWWIAFVVFLLVFIFFKRGFHSKINKVLFFINAGLLVIGFPYLRDALPLVFFIAIGIGFVLLGIFTLFCLKRFCPSKKLF